MDRVSFFPIMGAAGSSGGSVDPETSVFVAEYAFDGQASDLNITDCCVDSDLNIWVCGTNNTTSRAFFAKIDGGSGEVISCQESRTFSYSGFIAENPAVAGQMFWAGGNYNGNNVGADVFIQSMDRNDFSQLWGTVLSTNGMRLSMGSIAASDPIVFCRSNVPDFQGQLGDQIIWRVNGADGSNRSGYPLALGNFHDARTTCSGVGMPSGVWVGVADSNPEGTGDSRVQFTLMNNTTVSAQQGIGINGSQGGPVYQRPQVPDTMFVTYDNGGPGLFLTRFNNIDPASGDPLSAAWVKAYQSSITYAQVPYGLNGYQDAAGNQSLIQAVGIQGGVAMQCYFQSVLMDNGAEAWRSLMTSGLGDVRPISITTAPVNQSPWFVCVARSVTGGLVVFKLPIDGSGQGTYGNYNYEFASVSYTDDTFQNGIRGQSVVASAFATPNPVANTLSEGDLNQTNLFPVV